MSYNTHGSINKIMLIGRLGQDPDLKSTDSGTAVLNLSVATETSWKDKDGNQQTKTEWHKIVCWQKLAEIIAKYAKKGNRVYVEGRLETRSWEDNGVKKYITEVIADSCQILESKGLQSAEPTSQEQPSAVRGEFEIGIDGQDNILPF